MSLAVSVIVPSKYLAIGGVLECSLYNYDNYVMSAILWLRTPTSVCELNSAWD